MKAPRKSPSRVLNRLGIKAEAMRYFEALPDDAEIDFMELALVDGRTENALRQAAFQGRLGYPVIRHKGRKAITVRVGDIRKAKRELAAEAAAKLEQQPIAA